MRFDPVEKKWTYIAPMKCKRIHLGACIMDGKIYVIGGTGDTREVEEEESEEEDSFYAVEIYQHHTDTWTMVSQLNFQLHSKTVTWGPFE